MKRSIMAIVAAMVFALLGAGSWAAPVLAQENTIVDLVPLPPPDLPEPVAPRATIELASHRVEITVTDQVAVYDVSLAISNPGPRDGEADFVLPLPGDAAVTGLTLWIDGRRAEAQLLDADEALTTYTDIVRRQQDPALLEYAGQGAVHARVYPIPGYGTSEVEVTYTQVLAADAGQVALEYPFGTSLPNASGLELSLKARIASSQGVGTIYSPTHEVEIERTSKGATVSLATGDAPSPFLLYYGAAQQGVSSALMSYRQDDEDGYLLLLLTPGDQSVAADAVDRDIILVLDTSGSMRGEKLEQAQGAAVYILQHLNDNDRFGLISFSTGVYAYADELQSQTKAGAAVRYVRELKAEGGTNIDDALQAALHMADTGRPQVILFLTDGLPTVGEVSVTNILDNLSRRAGEDVQLFTFGVGYDVNTLLLDQAALDHHGAATYVLPEEDIEARVSSLYDKISLPVLTEVSLTVDGAGVYDLYPTPLPDLFAGQQLIVVGRYRKGGEVDITLQGQRNGESQAQIVRDLELARTGGDEFVPAVWAARKVGYLLTEIRLHGEDAELVDEVTALAERYGIVTPYTSWLADEQEDVLVQNAPMLNGPLNLSNGLDAAQPKTLTVESGAAAVEQSIAEQDLRDSERPAESAKRQVIGTKTLVLIDGVWTDTLWQDGMSAETVALSSSRYTELVLAHPDWGKYLALGDVLLVEDGQGYHFTD